MVHRRKSATLFTLIPASAARGAAHNRCNVLAIHPDKDREHKLLLGHTASATILTGTDFEAGVSDNSS